jgi:hypothetical protein
MYKVKTFVSEIRIFRTMKELETLDKQVSDFLNKEKVKKVISVSDATTTDDKGMTIGIIRTVCYQK